MMQATSEEQKEDSCAFRQHFLTVFVNATAAVMQALKARTTVHSNTHIAYIVQTMLLSTAEWETTHDCVALRVEIKKEYEGRCQNA